MKKLQTKTEPIPLLAPPKTDFEKRIAENLGYVEIASGQWVRFEPDPRPSVEMIRKWPYPHRCRACRGQFRSRRRVAYCGSCRRILDNSVRQLEAILRDALDKNAEQQREDWAKVEKDLTCPQCGWAENAGRVVPDDLQLILEYLRGWVERAHLHFFRHVFWNRFPYNRRFAPQISTNDMRSTYRSSPMDQPQILGFEIEHVGSVEFKPLGIVEIPIFRRTTSPVDPKRSVTSNTPADNE